MGAGAADYRSTSPGAERIFSQRLPIGREIVDRAGEQVGDRNASEQRLVELGLGLHHRVAQRGVALAVGVEHAAHRRRRREVEEPDVQEQETDHRALVDLRNQDHGAAVVSPARDQ